MGVAAICGAVSVVAPDEGVGGRAGSDESESEEAQGVEARQSDGAVRRLVLRPSLRECLGDWGRGWQLHPVVCSEAARVRTTS